ncbi:hypothetical protein FHS29_005194 [Saccharothrix tamanrassetensis]|uniref:Uncharacterized protein n=1 Tax=Saccharothrix tamanrassetensis TaxID=1051531 RepID=A0A841CT27_9PSEU|nr:hypothetical protein [Saccharothrix tamanrassetensis]MBB5958586.1 hypothetical protein [Saccharothrix tamanrassetensis]
MTDPRHDDETVERGAAEEATGTPLTDVEREVSERPPSDSPGNQPHGDHGPSGTS